MKSILKKVAIITAIIFVSSCASSGNSKLASMETNKVNDLFVDGKTTKKDVELALGQPDDIDIYNNGDEKWVYVHVRNDSKAVNFIPVASLFTTGTNDTKKKLVFIFNKDGSLQKHAFSKSRGETKAGLLGK